MESEKPCTISALSSSKSTSNDLAHSSSRTQVEQQLADQWSFLLGKLGVARFQTLASDACQTAPGNVAGLT